MKAWETARAVDTIRAVVGAADVMRRAVLREGPDGFDHLFEPDRVTWRGQIQEDEDLVIRLARRHRLALGPIRPW